MALINRRVMSNALSIVLILAFIATQAQSFRFDLQSGHTKCVAEDMKSHSMSVGKYHIVNLNEGYPLPDTHKVSVKVVNSHGTSYHTADNVHEGHFAFETTEDGDHTTCFFGADHKPPLTLTVDFEWKTGVAAKDWTNVAKKGSVEVMEVELKKMYEAVQDIHNEMFYLREREEEMQELNKSTNSKMAWMTGLSILVCLSVAGMQVWHLKSFFEKKKLI